MEIQSIYAATKTAAATTSTDGERVPASGFSALLDLVGSQFKATLGFGTMDANVLKKDASADAARAQEQRDAKPRAERKDDREDTKAKPAKDESKDDDTATDETQAASNDKSKTDDADAQGQVDQEQAVETVMAAVTDVTLGAETQAATTTTATDETTETVTDVAVDEVEVATAATTAKETVVAATEKTVDPKAAATETKVVTDTKAAVVQTTAKDTGPVQQATNTYASTQTATDADVATTDTETVKAEVKTSAKDAHAARALEARSANAQEQANQLARMLGNEARVQVQVSVANQQVGKHATADVSIYNIYSGYSAADAISLANGQFGQTDAGNAAQPAAHAVRGDSQAQAAAAVQAQPLPSAASNGGGQAATAARADGVSAVAIQASSASSGANNSSLNFGAFNNNTANNTTTQTQAPAQPNPTERPAATAQQVIDQIKVNITRAAKAGMDRVTIQLKPQELGRIEIKLEMSEDHKVRATVTADNKETLHLLQNDSRALERTLNDAGLRTDANNLHFNLRSDSDPRAGGDQAGGQANGGASDSTQTETANDNAETAYDYGAAASARGGVDTFA
ncbi:MAG: flagellar hook-length control protein FliK [Planctomycetales bacterium]|nr:flagellar hook-length control protein FliK [Planctomycetales bacterium]